VHVVLYSRPGCHLCDDARDVLLTERARKPFVLEEVDIETDDDLLREYGIRVPVVMIDGEERFEYRVDPQELAKIAAAG